MLFPFPKGKNIEQPLLGGIDRNRMPFVRNCCSHVETGIVHDAIRDGSLWIVDVKPKSEPWTEGLSKKQVRASNFAWTHWTKGKGKGYGKSPPTGKGKGGKVANWKGWGESNAWNTGGGDSGRPPPPPPAGW